MQHSFWKRALFLQMIGNNPAPYAVCVFFFNLQPPFQYAEPLSKSAMHQHNIPWTYCSDDYIAYALQLFYQAIWHSLDQRSHAPAKIEDNFLDACSIPIGKVQFSLFVVFLRPALSLKEVFLLSDIWKNCAFFLINCVHHFAEGTPQNNAWKTKGIPYHFRKSAAYAKGLHFGIKCHCLKIILYLTQGGYIIWRTKKMFYTFFKRYHTLFW